MEASQLTRQLWTYLTDDPVDRTSRQIEHPAVLCTQFCHGKGRELPRCLSRVAPALLVKVCNLVLDCIPMIGSVLREVSGQICQAVSTQSSPSEFSFLVTFNITNIIGTTVLNSSARADVQSFIILGLSSNTAVSYEARTTRVPAATTCSIVMDILFDPLLRVDDSDASIPIVAKDAEATQQKDSNTQQPEVTPEDDSVASSSHFPADNQRTSGASSQQKSSVGRSWKFAKQSIVVGGASPAEESAAMRKIGTQDNLGPMVNAPPPDVAPSHEPPPRPRSFLELVLSSGSYKHKSTTSQAKEDEALARAQAQNNNISTSDTPADNGPPHFSAATIKIPAKNLGQYPRSEETGGQAVAQPEFRENKDPVAHTPVQNAPGREPPAGVSAYQDSGGQVPEQTKTQQNDELPTTSSPERTISQGTSATMDSLMKLFDALILSQDEGAKAAADTGPGENENPAVGARSDLQDELPVTAPENQLSVSTDDTQPADCNPGNVSPSGSEDNVAEEQLITNWPHARVHWLDVSDPPKANLYAQSKSTLPYAACLRHWHSMVSLTHSAEYTQITPEEWEIIAAPLRKKAYASWKRLNELMEGYGDTIIDAWRGDKGADESGPSGKKKRKLLRNKRMKLIAKFWPNMASKPRPDLQVFKDRKPTDDLLPDPLVDADLLPQDTELDFESSPSPEDKSAQRIREALLWPHMNTEYLTTRWWYLTQMLQRRAASRPDYFAQQDMPPGRQDMLELFIRLKNVPNNFTIIFGDAPESLGPDDKPDPDMSDQDYGRLISTDQIGNVSIALSMKEVIPAGQGLLLLEVQEKLYAFLADMANAIFGSRPKTGLTASSGKNISRIYERWLTSSASAMMQLVWVADERDEAPYCVSQAPGGLRYHIAGFLECRRMFSEALLKAKCGEALDHWDLLRSDIGYFKETITQWKEHRVEMLFHTKGRTSPPPDLDDFSVWAHAIKDCVTAAFQKLIYWDEASRRMEPVSQLTLRGNSIHREVVGAPHPTDNSDAESLARARCSLYSFLSQWEGPSLLLLRKLWTFAPSLRRYSRRITQESSSTLDSSLPPEEDDDWRYEQDSEDEPLQKRKSREYLEWLFNSLFDRKVRFVLGMQTILDELDILMSSLPLSEHGILDSDIVSSQIADLAALSEVFHNEFRSERNSKYEMLETSREYRTHLIEEELKFDHRWKGGYKIREERLDKPENDAELKEARAQRAQGAWTFEGSSKMWFLGIPIVKPLKMKGNAKELEGEEVAFRKFWRKFDDELQAAHVCRWVRNGGDVLEYIKPPKWLSPEALQNYVKEEDRGIGGRRVQPQRPFKVSSKTGTPSEFDEDSDDHIEDEDDGEERLGRRHRQLKIRLDVDEQALNVFKIMLVPATEGWNPAPVPWKDFIHALLQADFKVFCRYGREWMAVPPQELLSLAFMFRQPRPGTRLTVATLRRYGLRLVWSTNGKLAYSQFSKRGTGEAADKSNFKGNSVTGGENVLESGYWLGTPYSVLQKTDPVEKPPRRESTWR